MFYSRVVQTNMALTEAARNAKVDISKATQLWLSVQNSVNALLDSSTGKHHVTGYFEISCRLGIVRHSVKMINSHRRFLVINRLLIAQLASRLLTWGLECGNCWKKRKDCFG